MFNADMIEVSVTTPEDTEIHVARLEADFPKMVTVFFGEDRRFNITAHEDWWMEVLGQIPGEIRKAKPRG